MYKIKGNSYVIRVPDRKKRNILALGAQSKGSFCFLKKDKAYFYESFGNLSDIENFENFQQHIKRVQRRIGIKPEIIACDLHPEYTASRHAFEMVKNAPRLRSGREGLRVNQIQHHEAHIASCIADNEVKGRVIGVAFDGTGLGSDGNIWGGEFFIGTPKKFKRAAHLKYIRMPGAEAAIREPWRMAFSYLYDIYGKETRKLDLGFMDKTKTGLLSQIIKKGINSPFTSSVGRLFDAVAAMIGICGEVEYEGQAAIELEKKLKAEPRTTHFVRVRGMGCRLKAEDSYIFKYNVKDEVVVIDWAPVIKGVVKDLKSKKSKAEISLKFHDAVCYMIKDTCCFLRKKYRVSKVCLSGGVFQNRYLTACIGPLLEKERFSVYCHKRLPAHDGNIALGQAVMA
ncbi:MAG: hypothetical protein KKB46_02175 [Candidatus Omnitrophica bacterium]|nr:hypothetical protein [Candidatus Omnitrophota bacterium]